MEYYQIKILLNNYMNKKIKKIQKIKDKKYKIWMIKENQ